MSQPDQSALLARAFLEIVPKTMWAVRSEVRQAARRRSKSALSVPQIRVLAQLSRQPLTNGELAERLGVSVPSMSRLVDVLARRGLVTRAEKANDRRCVTLKLSPAGKKYFLAVMKSVEDRFTEQFAKLDNAQAAALRVGLSVLDEVIQ